MLTNPVLVSVVIMSVLCLFRLNVILSLIVAALCGGMLSGMSISEAMGVMIGGMGGNAETALSYILLGALAAAIHKTGLATIISKKIAKAIGGKATILLLLLAGVACLSQNLIPVHIAFIPILVPPLLKVMNKLKIDRRAAACALTFGLKMPYISLPIGFGLIFHTIIADQMTQNGMEISKMDIWKGMWIPGLGMIVGLLVAIFISYRKERIYKTIETETEALEEVSLKLGGKHYITLLAASAALAIQVLLGSLPLGAIVALAIMVVFRAIKWTDLDEMIHGGIGMMGFIAFVMLIASGYGAVIRETGGVEALVNAAAVIVGGSQFFAAVVMILLGLVIAMGIGTSFGTIPIVAVIFVPLCIEVGFSPLSTAILIGTAAALGDAGSPASDSTLGPTSGLNADGQHNHIWDTCVPTFLHYNIPLVIFGIAGALIF